jgi:hypothetical protein
VVLELNAARRQLPPFLHDLKHRREWREQKEDRGEGNKTQEDLPQNLLGLFFHSSTSSLY